MNFLSKIKTGKEVKPRRCLLYGTHGVGKTTWASQAPSPIFIQTEDGLSDIGADRFPIAESFDQVLSMMGDLIKEEHKFKTLVIDSADWLERLIWEKFCKEKNISSIDDIDFFKGYLLVMPHWERFRTGLDILRNKKNMNIILICHSKVEKYNNPDGEDYDRYSPKLNKHASLYLQEWADEVFFANFQLNVVSMGKGFKEKQKAIGQGIRTIFTNEMPAYLAKNRLGIKTNIEMNWSAYDAHFSNNKNISQNEKGEK